MNTVRQTVIFRVPPHRLFEIYTDSREHSAATKAKAKVSRKVGARWWAFDGKIGGRNVLVVPHRLIVQAWRAGHWQKTDLDSILILKFSKARGGSRIDLVHTNLPNHDFKGVSRGWPNFYWKPWRAYLAAQARKARR